MSHCAALTPGRYGTMPICPSWLFYALFVAVPHECAEHGVTGFKARSPEEFGVYLRRLVEDAGLRTRMGAAARAEALSHHTPQAKGAAIRALFQEVTASRRPVASGAGAWAPRGVARPGRL